MIRKILLFIFAWVTIASASAQINYDETKVPQYVLPDLLTLQNGSQVKSRSVWMRKRRSEILSIFTDCMYGNMPSAPQGLHFKKICPDESVCGGMAIRRRVLVCLDKEETHTFEVMIHLPAGEGPFPVFVGLNFKETNDETVELESGRRWPYELITASGFAVATATRNSIEPDNANAPEGGVREWYGSGYSWGAISAWAWGISRIIDCLYEDSDIDRRHIAVIGHSRLGKTALWAGANDQRIALVVSNNAGCCGDAISRRMFGETFAAIRTNFPHWFCPAFSNYNEETFPSDQNGLAALIAPRPLFIGSAAEDLWADPKGEWLCARTVQPVYDLFGLPGLTSQQMLSPGEEDSAGTVAYKIRPGVHDILPLDWQAYIAFAIRHFK